MLKAAAKLIEDRLRQRRIARLRAHETEQLALPRRTSGAADRALDEPPAACAHDRGERDLHLGPHRTHLDEQLLVRVAAKQPVLAVEIGRASCRERVETSGGA